nr:hypothetical protein L204_04962 [Cryptococcus depauperatus CBS 7855]
MPGYFKASPAAVLHYVEPPLGIFPRFYAKQETTMVLKEHLLSLRGDDFGIKDLDGNVIAICKGKTLSVHSLITDPEGNFLYSLYTTFFSIPKRQVAEDAIKNGKELFTAQKHFSIKANMTVTFVNAADGEKTQLRIKGDMWGGSADISVLDGRVIAQIRRDLWKAKDILGGRQTYYVQVAPGVDLALIAGICISFDEAKNDRNKGGS